MKASELGVLAFVDSSDSGSSIIAGIKVRKYLTDEQGNVMYDEQGNPEYEE